VGVEEKGTYYNLKWGRGDGASNCCGFRRKHYFLNHVAKRGRALECSQRFWRGDWSRLCKPATFLIIRLGKRGGEGGDYLKMSFTPYSKLALPVGESLPQETPCLVNRSGREQKSTAGIGRRRQKFLDLNARKEKNWLPKPVFGYSDVFVGYPCPKWGGRDAYFRSERGGGEAIWRRECGVRRLVGETKAVAMMCQVRKGVTCINKICRGEAEERGPV